MNASAPLALHFELVTALPRLVGCELRLAPGECATLACDPTAALLVADLAQGLTVPDSGRVLTLGEDWRALGARGSYAHRARTGRMQADMGFVQNLNVDENVLLPQLDHTQRPEGELRAEAEALATRLGHDGLPATRPSATDPFGLAVSACVRAFLGAPDLVILATADLPIANGFRAGTSALVHEACARGAAVLWLGSEEYAIGPLPAGPRVRLAGTGFVATRIGRPAVLRDDSGEGSYE